ncbi:MAG: aminotransferase class III-fold pyridoxal phosphate-dependent enzyme [Candidatus Methanofastidiosia archaeon]
MTKLTKIDLKGPIPGPKAKEIIEKDKNYLAITNKVMPFVGARGDGVFLEDVDGNVVLDMMGGIAVLSTGHCHPTVVKAVQDQAAKLVHCPGILASNNVEGELAAKLAEITSSETDKKVYFSATGAAAIDCAINVTTWNTKRKRNIAFRGAFHGKTPGARSLTASALHYRRGMPELPFVYHVNYANCYRCPFKMEYPDCDLWCAKYCKEEMFDKYLPADEINAVFMEPIQGEGGYIVPPSDWVQWWRKFTSENDIMFVADEIQAGLGRTGKWFSTELHDVIPDLWCIAKGIASGYPMSAVVLHSKYDTLTPGVQATTFGGNCVTSAAALATIKVIEEENLLQNATKMGELTRKWLNEWKEDIEQVGDVRGAGLLNAIEIVKTKEGKERAKNLRNAIVMNALSKGVLILFCSTNSIRFCPPLNINEEQLTIGMEIVEQAIKEETKKFEK